MGMSDCRNIAILTAAALAALSLLSPATADESAQQTTRVVIADTDGAAARDGSRSPARVADEIIAAADDAGVGFAKALVRHAAPCRKRIATTSHPASRLAWIESIRPVKSILFLGVGF